MTNYHPIEEELSSYTNDLSLLFKDFDRARSLRFEDFCSCWRNLNFSFVHCGKKSAGDKNQGTERLLRCVSGYLNPETQHIYRIAAIYSAYAIFYTQICKPKVKIRMTVTMWKDLKQLQALVRQLKHNDVDYVITKLENDKAFVFTSMPKQLEYGNKESMANMESFGSEVNTLPKYYVPDQHVQETIRSKTFLESIGSLEDEYISVKTDIQQHLMERFDFKTISCLSSIRDCRSGLKKEIDSFRKWMETNTRGQAMLDDSQRPAAKSLTERKNNHHNIKTDISEKDKSIPTRAERIQALKLQSFHQPITETSQVQIKSVITEDLEPAAKKRTFQKRSALIERC